VSKSDAPEMGTGDGPLVEPAGAMDHRHRVAYVVEREPKIYLLLAFASLAGATGRIGLAKGQPLRLIDEVGLALQGGCLGAGTFC